MSGTRLSRVLSYVFANYEDDWRGVLHLDEEHHNAYLMLSARETEALYADAEDMIGVTLDRSTVVMVRDKERPRAPVANELTDRGNAERLVRLVDGNALYMSGRGRWMLWDGCHWAYDEHEELVRRYVPLVVEEIREEGNTFSFDMPKEWAKYDRFARSSQNTNRVNNMFTEARRTEGCLRYSPDALDGPDTRYLLNCRNATIDLGTGEDIGQERGRLISKVAPITYDPDAECGLWLDTIERIFDFEPDIAPFMQRVLGSCLTGDTADGKFFYLWGSGQNGKGTILDTMEGLLGYDDYGYAQHAGASTFCTQKGDSIPNDVACLRGARCVVVGEMGDLRSLNIALLKSITGGDPIKARFLREEFFTFTPQFKLLFQGNHRPELGLVNKAVERRFVFIPFLGEISDAERDDRLKEKLLAPENASGILNWLIEGCRDWMCPPKGADRLRMPRFVRESTETYLEDLNPIGEFLARATEKSAGNRLSHRELAQLYDKWRYVCDKPFKRTQDLASEMKDMGYQYVKPRNKLCWLDIAFNDNNMFEIEEEWDRVQMKDRGTLEGSEKPSILRYMSKEEKVGDF